MTGVRFPTRKEFFSLHHRVQTGSGPHPASYPLDVRGSISEIKEPEHGADNSPPASTEVKNEWNYTTTSQYVFMLWCLIKQSLYGSQGDRRQLWDFSYSAATQYPTQWVPGALTPEIRSSGHELNTQLHLVPRLRVRDVIPPIPNTSLWNRA